ncbi:MAG: hypothetical protein IKR62_05345 [Victivallales bacterium]|jgi:hypothetical protein|nr:hypothetical protein [Victivallales bacterium]
MAGVIFFTFYVSLTLVALTGYQGDTAIQFIFSFIFFQTAGGLSLGADNPNIASTQDLALRAMSLHDDAIALRLTVLMHNA